MTKYKVFGIIISYILFVTFVVNATGTQASGIVPPTEQEVPTGILLVLDAIIGFLATFWSIMTFQISGLPYWITMTFYVGSFMMFLIIVSLIRGTD